MKKIFASLVAATCFTSGVAYAGSSAGTVGGIMPHVGDIVIFTAGTHQSKPTCSASAGDDWALSLSTQTGKAMYAALLLAKAQGKTVTVVGDNVCSAWADREAPRYILVN